MAADDLFCWGSDNTVLNEFVGDNAASTALNPSGPVQTFSFAGVVRTIEVFFFCRTPTPATAMHLLFGEQILTPFRVRQNTDGSMTVTCWLRYQDGGSNNLSAQTFTIPTGQVEANTWHHLVIRRADTSTTCYLGKLGIDTQGNADDLHTFPYGGGAGNGWRSNPIVNDQGGVPSGLCLFRADGWNLPLPRVAVFGIVSSVGAFESPWQGGISEIRGWNADITDNETNTRRFQFVHDAGHPGGTGNPASPGASSIAIPTGELTHCWRFNENFPAIFDQLSAPGITEPAHAIRDWGWMSTVAIGPAGGSDRSLSTAWHLDSADMPNAYFPSHPFRTVSPPGGDVPVTGEPAAQPTIELIGSFVSTPQSGNPSAQPTVSVLFTHDEVEFPVTSAPPSVEVVGARDLPRNPSTPAANPLIEADYNLNQVISRAGIAEAPPSASLTFNWERGIAPAPPASPPAVSATATIDKPESGTASADPAVAVTAEKALIRSLAPAAPPTVMVEGAIGLSVFPTAAKADPEVSAPINQILGKSGAATADPSVSVSGSVSGVVSASGATSAPPSVSLVGTGAEKVRTPTSPAADPAVSAVESIDYPRSGTPAADPAVTVNLTFDRAGEAAADPTVEAEYTLNTIVSRSPSTAAAPSASATFLHDQAESAVASAAPSASASATKVGPVEPSPPPSTSASPSVTVVFSQEILLSATISEATGIFGVPLPPEDFVAVKDIWNVALVRLGAATISDTTDLSNEAKRIDAIWDEKRTDFLAEHTWNGAKKTVALTRFFNNDGTTVVTPPTRWSYTYVLPSDYIKAITLGGHSMQPHGDIVWEIESRSNDIETKRVLHTHLAPDSNRIELEYIWDVGIQVNLLGPKTRSALAAYIAWQVAENFGKSSDDIQQLEGEYKDRLAAAKSIDGQEGTPTFFAETGLAAVRDRDRFGGIGGASGFYGGV